MRSAIRSGELPAGFRLPPVRELAWQLGITPGTVARAYKLAAEEGLIASAVGRGSFVAGAPAPEQGEPYPLILMSEPNMVNFRAAQVPNVGQGQVIAERMRALHVAESRNYCFYPNSLSDVTAREAVRAWIGPERVGRFEAEDVVLTIGAQNATLLALQSVLHGSSPIILTDELSYPGVRHAARMLRAQVIGIKMDEKGLRPDMLEEALREHGAQVLLTSAEAHSPTAIRTPLERRQQIVAVARKYQLPIIEDDCHCIWWEGRPSYRAICPELSWYLSSLTKSVSSALRFGYMIPPTERAPLARQVAQSSFYGLPQPILDLCADLIHSGAADEIRQKVRGKIKTRLEGAVNSLGRFSIRYADDLGFLWLKMPQGWRASSFLNTCERNGIHIKPADEFVLPDAYSPNAVRIGVTTDIDTPRYEAALKALSDLLSVPPVDGDI